MAFQIFDSVSELDIKQPITTEAVGDSFFVTPTMDGLLFFSII